jgi:hypothetical protein
MWTYGWMLNWMVIGSEGLLRGAVSLVDWTRALSKKEDSHHDR